jgi:streptogrisin D
MRSRLTLIRYALVLMGIVVVGGVTSQPVSASPNGASIAPSGRQDTILVELTPEARAFWKTQEDLDRLAENIRASAPSSLTNGLSGVVVDAEDNTLQLYWHGTVPDAVAAHIDQARRDGTIVLIRQAPYTEVRLLQEADRISRLPLFSGAKAGQRMMRVGPKADGTGLEVGIHGLPPGVDIAQARQLVPAINSSNVSLQVSFMQPISFASRAFDIAPHWGGSFIHNLATGYSCSSAFSVTGNNGAATYLMTAAHCGTGQWGSYPFVSGGQVQQEVYGSTIAAGRLTGRDIELIRTPGGAEGGVYWGASIDPPNGGIGAVSGAAVGGSSSNSFGNAVCFSGSFSGTICPENSQEIRIMQVNQTITVDPPFNGVSRITNLVHAEHSLGEVVAGNGDSGGPAVSIRSDGRLSGRGVISAIDLGSYERPCVGWTPPGRMCSMGVYFADLRGAMNAVGVQINTM